MTTGQLEDIYVETLAVFERSEHQYEPLTTPEVTDSLDANRRAVYNRLQTLVERGYLKTKETGANSRVWWRPPTEPSMESQDDSGSVRPDPTDADGTETPSSQPEDVAHRPILEAIPDGVVIHDADSGEIIDANERYCEMMGYTREELRTVEPDAIHADTPPYTPDRATELIQRAVAGEPQIFEWHNQTKAGEQLPVEVHLQRATVAGTSRVLAVVRDITERKEREQELQSARQFSEELVENAPFGIFRLDEELRITYENPRTREMIGLPEDQAASTAIGVDIRELPSVVEAGISDLFTRLKDGEAIEYEFPFESIYGKEVYFSGRGVPLYRDGEFDGAVLMATDISERRERERELERQREFNEELVENAPFGMFRLNENLEITYENPRAEEIIGLPEDVAVSAGVGVDIRKLPPIIETGHADTFSRLQDGETIEFEFPFESIYEKQAYFTGRSVPLYRDGEFDGAVLMATDISERRQRERELERQREQLAALNELNDVVRGITDAVITQSTREEIEQVVCDRLAQSGSYLFAEICSVDSNMQIASRVECGTDSSLDETLFTTDAFAPVDTGPVGTAVRTQSVQIIKQAADDDSEPLWTEYARECGFQSGAVIPIVHQDVLFGVLGVWSDRAEAFTETEREVLRQLGEVVGHAIASVNRKLALMSDEVIELTLQIPDLMEARDVSVTADGEVTVDRVVPLREDEFLLYGTASEDCIEAIRALSESLPAWKALRIIDETDGTVRFEQRLSNPPVSSIIADHGGQFKRGRLESGAYTTTVHLPPGTDIRRLVTDIQEAYPSVEAVSQQQVSRKEPSTGELVSVLTERLTERQRAALEAGYYAGFFDWPRESSGEDVATSLDIGASTFHQHVRKAEKKLLDIVFTE